MKTLVIYPESTTYKDSVFYILDPETGECLASHFCSSSMFAKGDLHDNRKERLEEWKQKYEMDTEAKFIDETGYKWDEIYKKNQELAQKEVKN